VRQLQRAYGDVALAMMAGAEPPPRCAGMRLGSALSMVFEI
jgi:hypothetical protein